MCDTLGFCKALLFDLQFLFNLFAMSDIPIAGAIAQKLAFFVCHRLADMLDPAFLAVFGLDAELEFMWCVSFGPRVLIDPFFLILFYDNFFQECRIFDKVLSFISSDALTRRRNVE